MSETDPRREDSPPSEGAAVYPNAPSDNRPDDDAPSTAPATGGPVADPSGFRLRGDPPRVMRLSCKVLGVGAALGAIGIGTALTVALQTRDRTPAEPTELHDSERRAVAEQVTAAPRDYSQAPQLGEPLPGDLGRPILNAQQEGRDVPVPPIGEGAGQPRQLTPEEEARQREAQARERPLERLHPFYSLPVPTRPRPRQNGRLRTRRAPSSPSPLTAGRSVLIAWRPQRLQMS